jgi:cytochrome c2/cytochrome b561
MNNGDRNGWPKSASWAGWSITIIYFLQSCLTIALPRTDKTLPLREALRNWHVLIGVILLALVVFRLWAWWREERRMVPVHGLRSGLFNWGRTLALTYYLLLLSLPIFGFLFAWGGGTMVSLGPLFKLPMLLPESYGLWLFAGYFHSGAGFMMMMLNIATLLTAAYAWLRYGKGLLSAFPPGFGMQALLSMVTTSWAVATFKSNDPGPASVARFLGLVAIIWLIGWFLNRRRAPPVRTAEPVGKLRLASAAAALGIIAVGAYGPYAMFRVTPWPMGEVIAGPPGVTSHAAPIVRVKAWELTEFEQKTAMETYKWCGFCHTYKKNGKTKAGPNLYAIFGQRAASVPNFHFSPALAAKRNAGMVWDDETLDRFLANPDSFVPGTTMVVSSGPVSDAKVRRAVINMLKRDTMQGAIDAVPAPDGQ